MEYIKLSSCLLGITVLLTTCISKLDIETNPPPRKLIVDGFITDAPGPHSIRLLRLTALGSNAPNEINASVSITDNEGTETVLLEVEPGKYDTPELFQGKIGNSYTLNVKTISGVSYISTPQTIPDGPDIDSVIFRFKKLPSADPNNIRSGVEVFSQWQDPPEENFYLWIKHKGAYQIRTRPDLAHDMFGEPAPKDCCAICFVNEPVKPLNVLSDFRENGQTITASVAFIEDDGLRIKRMFFMELNQLNISREAFEFYDEVSTQLSINGSILDPPPSTITGNMVSTSDQDQIAIGFFGAFRSSTRLIEITPQLLEDRQREIIIEEDCRTVLGASTSRPDFLN